MPLIPAEQNWEYVSQKAIMIRFINTPPNTNINFLFILNSESIIQRYAI